MLFGLCLGLIAFWASVASAEGPFQKEATEWGFSVGFGDNSHIKKNVKEDIQFYFLTPSWGKVLRIWDRLGSSEFVIEGFLSYAQQESKSRYASGITSLLVHNFKPIGKTVFFLELGVGILYTDLNPKNFGSNFNFTPQGGIGLRYKIRPGVFLKFSYRFHHISNAGIDEDNRSIDSHFFSLGVSFF